LRFSIVTTTRDRPALLRRALASIARQTFTEYELVVVDDGSKEEFAAEYDAIADELGNRGRFHRVPEDRAGGGPSRARNYGLERCSGDFVAFLDDDDEWTDPDYLAVAADALDRNPSCDLHLANQEALSLDGALVKGPVWIEDLTGKLRTQSGTEWQEVAVPELLLSDGFCHFNTTIGSRRLLQTELGGFDESVLYEEDRELYLRAIEAARLIIYNPRVVARHHVPDRRQYSSASTRLTAEERTAFRLQVLDKTISRTKRPDIIEHCRRLKAYTLKAMATREAARGNFRASYGYALDALSTSFSYKWLGFTGWVWLRGKFPKMVLTL